MISWGYLRYSEYIYIYILCRFLYHQFKFLCKMVNAMFELFTFAKNVVFMTKFFLLKEKMQIDDCSKSFLFFYVGLYWLWTIEHVYATDTFFHTIWHLWEFHDRINKGVKSHRFACLTLLISIYNFSNRKSFEITKVVQINRFQSDNIKYFFSHFYFFNLKKQRN